MQENARREDWREHAMNIKSLDFSKHAMMDNNYEVLCKTMLKSIMMSIEKFLSKLI